MRYWQAEAITASGGTVIFGVRTKDLPRALRKAFEMLAEHPGIARHLTVRRIPSPQRRRPLIQPDENPS